MQDPVALDRLIDNGSFAINYFANLYTIQIDREINHVAVVERIVAD